MLHVTMLVDVGAKCWPPTGRQTFILSWHFKFRKSGIHLTKLWKKIRILSKMNRFEISKNLIKIYNNIDYSYIQIKIWKMLFRLYRLHCRILTARLHLGKHRQSRVRKTYCSSQSHSISVNYLSKYLMCKMLAEIITKVLYPHQNLFIMDPFILIQLLIQCAFEYA